MANNYSWYEDNELYGDSEEITSTGVAVDTGMKLVRERYNNAKDGKRYWLYYTMAPVFGKEAKVNFTTSKKDRVLYEQIAFMFASLGVTSLPIYMQESKFKGSDGKEIETTRYFVLMKDEDGDELQVKIKPKNESDAGFWKHYIDKLKRRLKREAEEAKAAAEVDDVPGDVPAEQPSDKPEKNKKG